jgi:PKHD-type hydroxylase
MHDYWLWNSVLPKWFCEEQINNINWTEKEQGKVKKGKEHVLDLEKRITDIVWEDISSPIGCIAQVYINMANENAGWNFNLSNTSGIQIGKYDSSTKGFYDWHTDDGLKPKENGLVRKLSVSILLSDTNDFEGGMFEFENFDTQPILKQGSIIVFPSQISHRVTPVTLGTRYSAVTWVQGPAYR